MGYAQRRKKVSGWSNLLSHIHGEHADMVIKLKDDLHISEGVVTNQIVTLILFFGVWWMLYSACIERYL